MLRSALQRVLGGEEPNMETAEPRPGRVWTTSATGSRQLDRVIEHTLARRPFVVLISDDVPEHKADELQQPLAHQQLFGVTSRANSLRGAVVTNVGGIAEGPRSSRPLWNRSRRDSGLRGIAGGGGRPPLRTELSYRGLRARALLGSTVTP